MCAREKTAVGGSWPARQNPICVKEKYIRNYVLIQHCTKLYYKLKMMLLYHVFISVKAAWHFSNPLHGVRENTTQELTKEIGQYLNQST